MKNTAKKLILSTFAATSVLLSYGQRTGLWITPHMAVGAGTMTDTYPLEWTPKASAIFTIGADATYMFNNHIGVATGITYGGYGFLWEQINLRDGEKVEVQCAQATLDVPIYFRAVTGSGGGFLHM